MKKKAYKRQKRRVEKLFEYWVPRLGLGAWHIEVRWYDNDREFTKAGNRFTAMRVEADWQYCRAYVSVCVPVIADLDDDRLEWAVAHELAHVIVNEMREDDGNIKHEERVVSHLASAFLWTRDRADVD